MAKKRLFGSKGPLIYATIVSLICVMSASISTFAWFQAEANVQIQTTSSSANISVSKPDDITATFYYYDGNQTNGYASKGNNTTFRDLASNVTALPGITAVWPGYKATYMVKAKGSTSIKVNLAQFTATANTNRNILNDNYADSGKDISAAYAMKIYSQCYASERHSDYLDYVDGLDADSDANAIAADHFQYYNDPTKTSCNIATATPATSNTFAYIYFTIIFDDHDSANYAEYSATGSASNQISYQRPDNAARYFKQCAKSSGGTSNCFMGLIFTINKISLAP